MALKIFEAYPEVKKALCGGELEYEKLYEDKQLGLFD